MLKPEPRSVPHSMQCAYFNAAVCRSCVWLPVPYATQLAQKAQSAATQLAAFTALVWLPPVPSAEQGFRNKAKMVVSGSSRAPKLGILDARGQGVDLTQCGLYPKALSAAFEPIKRMITRLALTPYEIAARRGELKYVLITHSAADNSLMVRLVLRSTARVSAIQADWLNLVADLPQIAVLSVNIQPVHQAILEGETELILSPRETLTMVLNGLPFYLRPRSFFQTNTAVAAQLYATARDWVAELAPRDLWDLFCGVGGFALHCAPYVSGEVTGIEVSAEAIASAQQSAAELGLTQARFRALTADDFVATVAKLPALVVVNPPRRGLGTELCRFLHDAAADQSRPLRWMIYSSCNPESLARDLAAMPSFTPIRAQLFDLFPHTAHSEVLVLLERKRTGKGIPQGRPD
ncbi:MAG TPA: 23S rRNA (uracil(747)-C(5))-methyltransferase RlmC [Halothiobacillus sp.]|nr:23S rRNA (uracil(747)-C(5))-methyltransferase RlmC [Halothiobacillus sp.]HQS29137.1 23S rRNA (uracil(747)-C(5))-methyltransferase RlmC [Halothiobacillus sp.]